MKNKTIQVSILALMLMIMLMLVVVSVKADVIPSGRKGINHCFKIANIDAYPDYTFISNFYLQRETSYSYVVVNLANTKCGCVNFPYYSNLGEIYAIKTSEFNKANLSIEQNMSCGGSYGSIIETIVVQKYDYEEGSFWVEYQNVSSYEPFVSSLNNLPSNNVTIEQIIYIPENDPLKKIVDVLEITNLSENNLEIKKSKVIYTYTNGIIEEKVYETQDKRPEPSRKSLFPWWFTAFWYIIIPVCAILIIGIILLIRKRKCAISGRTTTAKTKSGTTGRKTTKAKLRKSGTTGRKTTKAKLRK